MVVFTVFIFRGGTTNQLRQFILIFLSCSFCLPLISFDFLSNMCFIAHLQNFLKIGPFKNVTIFLSNSLWNHWPEASGEHLPISAIWGCELIVVSRAVVTNCRFQFIYFPGPGHFFQNHSMYILYIYISKYQDIGSTHDILYIHISTVILKKCPGPGK